MGIFETTINQTAYLFFFIVLGYILSKGKWIPEDSQRALSKLESYVFIPALVLGTFINNCTPQKLSASWELLLGSFALEAVVIAVSVPIVRVCSRDKYEQNIFLYGLCFANFGFVGNAIVSAVFPEIFLEYLLFTLPFWTLIYLWGMPVLLMGSNGKQSLAGKLKNFLNPMLICMLLGIVIGVTGVKVPRFLGNAADAAGACMSPVAMLLTGIALGRLDLREILKIKSNYWVTLLRLVIYPGVFLLLLWLVPMPKTFAICAVCALSMPLGLNTIIIPGALGKDTKVASGMALVSHVFACLTIPAAFAIMERILG